MNGYAVLAQALGGGAMEMATGFVSLALLVVLVAVVAFSVFSLINTLVEITMYLVVAGVVIGVLFLLFDPLSIDAAMQFFTDVMRLLGEA